MGLMQLMPGTAEGLGVSDAYNIEENIRGGTEYLSRQLEVFNNNVDFALAAYNAGPNAVTKYNGIPPYEQTQNYVKLVKKYYEMYKALD
jgi:soluble lytic murein transglycosylase-like protein